MKSLQLALIVALILPLGGNAMADPRPAKHSGTSSYKSGFSSQKSSRGNGQFGSFSNKAKPAAPAPTPAPAAAPNASGRSAMSRDLQQSQSQANALNTLDARRNAANGNNGNNGQALPPLNDRVPGVDRTQQQPYGPAPVPYGQQQPYNQPPPVVVQQSGGGGGLGAALMGFMLGRSMSASAHQGYYPANGSAGQGQAQTQGGGVTQAPPAPAPASSFGSTVLRTFAWLVLLGVIGWGIYFGMRALKRGKARRTANYSFERD